MATYMVTGAQHRVMGHGHGDEFDAELDSVLEERLIAAGHIERLDSAVTSERKEDEGDE